MDNDVTDPTNGTQEGEAEEDKEKEQEQDIEQEEEDFENAQSEAKRESRILHKKVNEAFSRMSTQEQKNVSRKAQRTLHAAQQYWERLQKFIQQKEDVESEVAEETQVMEQLSESEGSDNEQQSQEGEDGEEEAKTPSTRRILLWWKRFLESVSQLVVESFGDMFEEVGKFLESFKSQKKQLEDSLDTKCNDEEVKKTIHNAQRHLDRLQSSIAKGNEKVGVKARDQLDEQLYYLREMHSNHPLAVAFLQQADSVILEFDTKYEYAVELKEMKKQQRMEKVRKSVNAIKDLRSDIDNTMNQLNQQLSNKMNDTISESQKTTQKFRESHSQRKNRH